MMKCAARIKPDFLPHFIILISQAIRDRTGQVALWGGGYGRACADSQRTSAPSAWALNSRTPL